MSRAARAAFDAVAYPQPQVSYFQAVRMYSLLELSIFAALLVVAVGGFDEHAELVLGWTHGIGWILLCIAVAIGCRQRTFPWTVLAATVSPLGPVGSTIAIEYLSRRRTGGQHRRRLASGKPAGG